MQKDRESDNGVEKPGVTQTVSGRGRNYAGERQFTNSLRTIGMLAKSEYLSVGERGFVNAASQTVVCERCLGHP